ncbi:MAG: hypothetical protein AAF667_01345 [Pseudomonadota bacterium]
MLWQSAELPGVVVSLHVENYFKRVREIAPDQEKREAAMLRLPELRAFLDTVPDRETISLATG